MSIDKRVTDALPRWPLTLTAQLPPWRQLRGLALRRLGIPAEVLESLVLGDVANRRHREGAVLCGKRRQLDVHWELCSILAQAEELAANTHRS